ncbi:MAG: hypothetical protein Q8L14_22240 [Myxococcales bacterium]|nr:hypothetical protein [Myxococcales bacterium]
MADAGALQRSEHVAQAVALRADDADVLHALETPRAVSSASVATHLGVVRSGAAAAADALDGGLYQQQLQGSFARC